jgi:hypothetical protein
MSVQGSPGDEENKRITGGKARTSYLVMWRRGPLKGCEEVDVPSWVCKERSAGWAAQGKSGARAQLVIVR